MNVMTDIWTVFGADQGQADEIAYRYDLAGDRIIRRFYDRSDMTVDYDAADCPADVEWAGAEGTWPWSEPLEWRPCDNPFTD